MLRLLSEGSWSCQVIPQNNKSVYMTEELKDCMTLTLCEVLGNCMDIWKDGMMGLGDQH